MPFPPLIRRWRFVLAGLVLGLLYGIHFLSCARSALVQFSFLNSQTDMYGNLLWAKSIHEQGWLNPHPYHPDFDWMHRMGTRADWMRWWGGDAIFQQSPLYAYLLSILFWLGGNILFVHLFQSLMGMGLCILTGLIARRVTDDSRAGWLAFWLAALYSPYYAYSWPLLRDLLGWFITAGVLLLLLEVEAVGDNQRRKNRLMLAVGFALGMGYLARETYSLIIPLVLMVFAVSAIRRRQYGPLVLLLGGLALVISPLCLRNLAVGAPPGSSSNRFAEAFIEGNAASSLPNQFLIPPEMHDILEKSGGKPGRVVAETINTHPNVWSFLRLETWKLLSLLDPYEPPDNLSLYFMATISPPVHWGLRHWMVIVPGLGGLALSLHLKDRRHFWLWLMLAPLLAGMVLGTPVSRYRQSLLVLWLPWAAFFLVTWWTKVSQNRRWAWGIACATVLGWTACLTIFARIPRNQYERPFEYIAAIWIYEDEGQSDKAEAMKHLFHQKFPSLALPSRGRNGQP
jgi:4-amino-4-deoxy-L-arabinose transferase-like glycosyltransferase